MAKLDVDPETGIVRSGKYAGVHVDEVMEYLEHLEAAASEGAPPAPKKEDPPAGDPPPRDPKKELENRAGGRIDAIANITGATAMRLEQDDEEAFAATVSDYDTKQANGESFRETIAKMKKTMPAAARTGRGVHRNAYLFLKTQDPAVQNRILGREEEEPLVEEEEENEEAPPADPPVVPPPGGDTPPPAAAKTPVTPKPAAAPPAAAAGARSPGGRRNAPPPPAVPKLKATDKIERIAHSFGISVAAYLKQLEEQGVSQDTINAMSLPRNAGGPATGGSRRKTVFDR